MVSVLLSEIGKCGFLDAEYWGEVWRGGEGGDFDIGFDLGFVIFFRDIFRD